MTKPSSAATSCPSNREEIESCDARRKLFLRLTPVQLEILRTVDPLDQLRIYFFIEGREEPL